MTATKSANFGKRLADLVWPGAALKVVHKLFGSTP
jgi:hypothetical protein